MRTFGETLKAVRREVGITQEELARRLGYRRSATVALLETSERLPLPDTIMRLALALGVKPSRLLDGIETEYEQIKRGVYDSASGRAKFQKARDQLTALTQQKYRRRLTKLVPSDK